MLRANVTTYVFALIEITVVHVFLHALATHHGWTHHADAWIVVHIIQGVGISYVLSVDAATAFNHWQLLGVKIFVRIWCKSSSMRFLMEYFILPSRSKIWQLLLSFAKLFIRFLFIGVDSFNLVGASDLNFSTMAAHILRVLAILTQWIWKSCSHTALS